MALLTMHLAREGGMVVVHLLYTTLYLDGIAPPGFLVVVHGRLSDALDGRRRDGGGTLDG